MLHAAKVKPPAVNGLEFPYQDIPPTAQVREVAPGRYWLRMPLPFYDLHERVSVLRLHYTNRLDALQRAGDEPRSGATPLPVIFKRGLGSQQMLLAMGATLSHLNFLEQSGQRRRTIGTDGVYRYARTRPQS